MDKINGYPRSEAEELVRYVGEGRRMGKTLTSLFASYGMAHGRAGGSVRNYYYKLLKTKNAAPLLAGKNLRAETIVPFTDAETEEMLRSILSERKKGCSVRRAIANVCGGDAKKMLRYQNKYRNMLKKQPDAVRAAAKKAGITVEVSASRPAKSELQKRVEAEINALYDRLAVSLREENERLKRTIERLNEENELLRRASRVKNALIASRSAENKAAK